MQERSRIKVFGLNLGYLLKSNIEPSLQKARFGTRFLKGLGRTYETPRPRNSITRNKRPSAPGSRRLSANNLYASHRRRSREGAGNFSRISIRRLHDHRRTLASAARRAD